MAKQKDKTFQTASGEFNYAKGAAGDMYGMGGLLLGGLPGALAAGIRSIGANKYGSKAIWGKVSGYEDWSFANHDMNSLTNKKISKGLDIAIPYIQKGGSLNLEALKSNPKVYNELKAALGDTNFENKVQYLAYAIESNGQVKDANGNVLNSAGQPFNPETGETVVPSSSDNGSGISKYEDLIKNNLMTDAASRQAQQYRDAMYGSIAQYENTANATLANAEMDAYRALGQSQLQLENQIAAERMNAIKSGVTSAQLASREIASMFATQTGAAQVASQMAQNRADMANQFGQQRAAVESDLWNVLNGNQQTAANAYAQLGTAQASYNSYINSYAAQLQAMMNAWRSDPYAYSQSSTARSKAED